MKVEEYLNQIDYSKDINYIPSDFALEFINLIKLVNGGDGEENLTPVLHYKMLNDVASKQTNIANMVFRGAAKSALFAEYLFLYLALYGSIPNFGKINYALYVSDSIENGVKKMRLRLEGRIQKSKFLQAYIKEIKFTDIRWYFKNADNKEFVVTGHGARSGVRGPLALNELVYLDTGIKKIVDVNIGEWVYKPDGEKALIKDKSEIIHEPMYKITFEDGRCLKVSLNHLNALFLKSYKGLKNATKVNILTKDLLNDIFVNGLKNKYGYRYYMQTVKPINYSKKQVPLDPYLLGLLLGDGCITKRKGVKITGLSNDVRFYFNKLKNKYRISIYDQIDKRKGHLPLLRISIHGISDEIEELKLDGVKGKDKFIPYDYFFGSIEQRKELLAGLLDIDGSVDKRTGSVSYTTISKKLALGIQELGRSLGMYVSLNEFTRSENKENLFRLTFCSSFNPFKLTQKANYWKLSTKWNNLIALIDIKKIKDCPSICILLDDPIHEFVSTNYIPTHNTVELNTRPQLAVLDDLISDEDAKSDTIIANVEEIVYKAIDYALHPTRHKIIWSGTPFNAKDPLYKAVESDAWAVNVFPVCEQFPCSKKEFKGSWEDRFPYEYVKHKYDTAVKLGRIDTFNQEMMLRIMSDEDRLIQDHEIGWYKRKSILENKGLFNFYITTDFATSEKQSADYSVISVWAYNNIGDWLWVDGICKKQTMDKNIYDLFRLAQEYSPQQVGIEISGQQKGFVSWVQNEMITRNVYFPLASENNNGNAGIRPNTQKMVRFNVMVPLFKTHKIFFPTELKQDPAIIEAINELSLISAGGIKSKHDDFIDTISMLASLQPWKPTQIGQLKKEFDRDVYDMDLPIEEENRLNSYIV